jgi:hypothetical protein
MIGMPMRSGNAWMTWRKSAIPSAFLSVSTADRSEKRWTDVGVEKNVSALLRSPDSDPAVPTAAQTATRRPTEVTVVLRCMGVCVCYHYKILLIIKQIQNSL